MGWAVCSTCVREQQPPGARARALEVGGAHVCPAMAARPEGGSGTEGRVGRALASLPNIGFFSPPAVRAHPFSQSFR